MSTYKAHIMHTGIAETTTVNHPVVSNIATSRCGSSRAPLADIERFRQRMGWKFKWVSSHGSDFNHDFGVSFTPEERAKGNGEVYGLFALRCAGFSRLRVTWPELPAPRRSR